MRNNIGKLGSTTLGVAIEQLISLYCATLYSVVAFTGHHGHECERADRF